MRKRLQQHNKQEPYITIDAVGRVNIGVAQDNSLVELINGAVSCPLLIEAGTSYVLA